MTLWKKLFGSDSSKAGIVQRKSSRSPAIRGDQLASFQEALWNQDLKRVAALLAKISGLANAEVEIGKNPFIFASGERPLHLAAAKGHKELVKLLLSHKADVNSKCFLGGTPLHAAAQNGSKEVTELLLAHNAEVNAHDSFGYTPLHLAARDGRKEVAELLLANNAEINAKGFNGSTPLHLAVLSGSKELVKLLLARNVEVHVMDNQGKTPSRLAEENGYKDVAEMLPHQGESSLRCPVCQGSGLEWRSALHGGGYRKCRVCSGTGNRG